MSTPPLATPRNHDIPWSVTCCSPGHSIPRIVLADTALVAAEHCIRVFGVWGLLCVEPAHESVHKYTAGWLALPNQPLLSCVLFDVLVGRTSYLRWAPRVTDAVLTVVRELQELRTIELPVTVLVRPWCSRPPGYREFVVSLSPTGFFQYSFGSVNVELALSYTLPAANSKNESPANQTEQQRPACKSPA
jgi:hypothetical protein